MRFRTMRSGWRARPPAHGPGSTPRPVSPWGNIYYDGDWGGLKADYSKVRDGLPIFDLSGFYFHDAAVQTNGVDDPAKQRGVSDLELLHVLEQVPHNRVYMRVTRVSYAYGGVAQRFGYLLEE